jgi:hypothetical protein
MGAALQALEFDSDSLCPLCMKLRQQIVVQSFRLESTGETQW